MPRSGTEDGDLEGTSSYRIAHPRSRSNELTVPISRQSNGVSVSLSESIQTLREATCHLYAMRH